MKTCGGEIVNRIITGLTFFYFILSNQSPSFTQLIERYSQKRFIDKKIIVNYVIEQILLNLLHWFHQQCSYEPLLYLSSMHNDTVYFVSAQHSNER